MMTTYLKIVFVILNNVDLKNEPDFWENIETEHEKMFADQGIKIKALIAKKTK